MKLYSEVKIGPAVDSRTREGKRIALIIHPRQLKSKDEGNEQCKLFAMPHDVVLVEDVHELVRIEVKYLGEMISLVNLPDEKGFRAVYAYDSDSGSESTTLEYAGQLAADKVSGHASMNVDELGKRCAITFSFNERLPSVKNEK